QTERPVLTDRARTKGTADRARLTSARWLTRACWLTSACWRLASACWLAALTWAARSGRSTASAWDSRSGGAAGARRRRGRRVHESPLVVMRGAVVDANRCVLTGARHAHDA